MPDNTKSPEYWDKRDAFLNNLKIIGTITTLVGFTFGFRVSEPGFWTASEVSLILKVFTGISLAFGTAGAILLLSAGSIKFLRPETPQPKRPCCHRHD